MKTISPGVAIENLKIRETQEEREEVWLSLYAARSAESKGRELHEPPDPVRTAFQRDRDRILHCKSFRRLKHKTQVFIAPVHDHYRTRLTHTLEVAQIARTIARSLRLNEDLTEAIALGHDLGHTPFGHAGEEIFSELLHRQFRHNEQSLRVVEKLEKKGQGLNLTWEVRDGILRHSKVRHSILAEGWGKATTLEGQVVKIADSIAYVNHDIDDAVRAEIISEEDLPEDSTAVLGSNHSQRINTMVCDVIINSWDKPVIQMSREVLAASDTLREFLFQNVYTSSRAKSEVDKAKNLLKFLYHYYLERPEELPPEFLAAADSKSQAVIDYLAGMTDQYALEVYQRTFIPQLWQK